jgi:regulatory protein
MAFPSKKNESEKGAQTYVTPFVALEKIKYYCKYQERCHSEVNEKLNSYGLTPLEVGNIIAQLIEDDLLNEERFAVLYAGGHFRTKKWGKVKIAHALRLKKVSAYCIKKGLQEIEADDYDTTLQKLAATKWASLKKERNLARMAKCRSFLLQKGYENDLVMGVLKELETKER